MCDAPTRLNHDKVNVIVKLLALTSAKARPQFYEIKKNLEYSGACKSLRGIENLHSSEC